MPALRSLFSFLVATTLLTACSQDDDPAPKPDTVVFGHFYGYCLGEQCIEIFRLDARAHTLAEDTTDTYPSTSSAYEGKYAPRSADAYAQVSDLPALIPAQLLSETQRVIGQPDAGDWGGYYLEINEQGTRRFWLIDTQKRNIPAYLHPLLDALQERIQRLH
ncbi:hypothetical protein K3G63_10780 [Hymenobacter sp. HSC-4F20]|uniref:hypothetical protein n=1 Tax=Hymenobacter sp. HSC-4F20 TaxID=2864135 RepID=UPI001C73B157|nr:hypothetical protein [Hymenobacter sp. HSC-4F20]MBX0290927.1 hypothetical protein [Hymenobacter sp. HSC-4F20]